MAFVNKVNGLSNSDPQSNYSPYRLLIVDAIANARLEIQRLLRNGSDKEYLFADADSGESAVKQLQNTQVPAPNCLLLSDSLADLNATDVLNAIRTPTGLPLFPVVVLTPIASAKTRPDLLRAGASDYVNVHEMTPQSLTRVIDNAAERWDLASTLIQRSDELAESEKQFQVIFASTAVGIARVELDGRFAMMNDAFCRIQGYEKEELLKLTVQEVTHPDDVAADMEMMQKLLDGSLANYTLEKRKIRKDGSMFWVNHAVSLDRRADGTPFQFISAVHDISDRKFALEELYKTNSRLHALMNALPVGVSFSDDTTCERIAGNPAVLAQFAVQPADNLSASAVDRTAPGRQVQFFSGGRTISDSELPLQRAVEEDRIIAPMYLDVLMPDGRRWYAEASGAPIHDENGKVVAGVAVTVDVTARREAEISLRQSEERRRLTLEAGAMGTFEVNLLTGEGVWNSVEFELLGLQEGEAVPCPETFFQYVHPDDAAQLQHDWDRATQSGKLDTEFRIIRADGRVRWLAGKGSYFYESDDANEISGIKPTRFLGVNYDITTIKQAEESVRQLNSELEDRVRQRTAQLEAANKELEAFTYSVSHDMRAPVRAIDGFTRILQEEHISNISPQAADCLDEVSRNAKYMGRLIDDLLNFSRLGRRALRLEECWPGPLVQRCVDELNCDKTAQILLLEMHPCRADAFLMKLVWMNLLGNALKYSSRSNPPLIEVGSNASPREVTYYIKDNGVGFDMRYADKLFGVFQRLHRQEDY